MRLIAKTTNGGNIVELSDWELEAFNKGPAALGAIVSVKRKYGDIEIHRNGNWVEIFDSIYKEESRIAFYLTIDGIAIDQEWEAQKAERKNKASTWESLLREFDLMFLDLFHAGMNNLHRFDRESMITCLEQIASGKIKARGIGKATKKHIREMLDKQSKP